MYTLDEAPHLIDSPRIVFCAHCCQTPLILSWALLGARAGLLCCA